MSGHSKWATIKHQKEANDRARGAVFSKLSRAITVAVQEGGGETNPEANFKLRLAIERAREANMPKANIERAIQRASGGEGERLVSIQFEGYGPAGVGVIVEAITDKRQRTVQEIKNFFEKNGGSIASPGAVAYNFERKGEVIVEKKKEAEEEMLLLMDIDGVEDLQEKGEGIRVITQSDKLATVAKEIKDKEIKVKSSRLIFLPRAPLFLDSEEKKQKVNDFVAGLLARDDIQAVFTNLD